MFQWGVCFFLHRTMQPDLSTVLMVRLGVDVLIAGAFWAQMRRYPNIGGPGWWSLSSLISIAGTVALMQRVGGSDIMGAALAAALLLGANAMAWIGVRSYLRLSMPWRTLGVLLLGHAVLQFALAHWGQRDALLQLVYAIAALVLAGLLLRDLLGVGALRSEREYRELTALTVLEVITLIAMVGWMAWRRSPLDSVSAALLLFFLLTKFMRALIFGALVSLRLRQDVERARQSMAEREAGSRALITHLGAGVVVFRPDQSIVLANNAARRFFGWPSDDTGSASIPLVPDWNILREDGVRMPRHEVPFQRVLASGQPVSDVVSGVRAGGSGELRWALCNAFPENDAHGGLRHVIYTFVDITSLKQAQQRQRVLESQLAQSQKMEALGTLAGGVAHDFNNILAAILGNAHLARQDLVSGSSARECLHEISHAARRGRELVRQILAFSRQQPLARTPVCPRAMVTETCNLLRTAIAPQVQLVQRVAPAVPAILADPTRLGQVLLNLGTNASHALRGQPGQISFEVDAVGADHPALTADLAAHCRSTGLDAVRIEVRDNGCGMDAATRERIFEPFFTTKEVGQGTGLGLPVVLGIVEAHGGAIAVDSRLGEGTAFTLYFPATSERPPAPFADDAGLSSGEDGTITGHTSGIPQPSSQPSVENPAMADEPNSTPRHILYLDDDDTLVFLVRRLLERRGYKVTALTDQQEAIDAVRNAPEGIHLLMTDYNMPGMSGIDVARAVLAINPQLPVAVASGYISDELQAEAAAAGVTEVVFKTDAVEAFCEVVARLVGGSHQAR
jgi:PAS domain S-box-containing protein